MLCKPACAGLPWAVVPLPGSGLRPGWGGTAVDAGRVVGKVAGKGPDGYRDALAVIAEELGVESW